MPKSGTFDEQTVAYDAWFERNRPVYQVELEAIRQVLPLATGALGVEVGIGSGRFAAPLGIGMGVEPSIRMAATARLRDVRVVLGVAEKLPLQSEPISC